MPSLILLAFLASGCSCDADASGAPAEPLAVFQGELLSITFDSEIFGRDHHRAILDTGSTEVEFLVAGRSDVLEVGTSYEVGLTRYDTGGEWVAFLDSSVNCGSRTTIRQLDENGTAFDIEVPRRIPSWPVSRNQILIGFGVLAMLTFAFRQR